MSTAPRFIARELVGQRALHLEHDIGGAERLGGVGRDRGARGCVGIIGEGGRFAGAPLHDRLEPQGHEVLDRIGRRRDPALVRTAFLRDADLHCGEYPSGVVGRRERVCGAQGRANRPVFVKVKATRFALTMRRFAVTTRRFAVTVRRRSSHSLTPCEHSPDTPTASPRAHGIKPIATRSHPVWSGRAAPGPPGLAR